MKNSDDSGYTGKHVGVCVLDTGIFPHIDFTGRILAFQDFIGHRIRPYDDNSHGTHVCGIIGGDGRASEGRIRGIAPGVADSSEGARQNGKWQERRCFAGFSLDSGE